MINFIKNKIKQIVYEEYNHIIIDSERYLEFEDFIIDKLFYNNYLEEGFRMEIILNLIKNNIKDF